MEEAITGDFSLIKAHKADEAGNLTFRLTANNFNQPMASAGKITIVEVRLLIGFLMNTIIFIILFRFYSNLLHIIGACNQDIYNQNKNKWDSTSRTITSILS